MRPDLGQNMQRNLGQPARPNLGLDMQPDLGQDMRPDLGQNMRPDLSQNMRPDLGQSLSPLHGPELVAHFAAHQRACDAALASHSLKLDSHRDELLAQLAKVSDVHDRNHARSEVVINNLRSDRDDLSDRLGVLSDARDVEHASLVYRFNEHQASLVNRFVEHELRMERPLSVHRSELDTALDRHRAALDEHKGELDARLQDIEEKVGGEIASMSDGHAQTHATLCELLDGHRSEFEQAHDDLRGQIFSALEGIETELQGQIGSIEGKREHGPSVLCGLIDDIQALQDQRTDETALRNLHQDALRLRLDAVEGKLDDEISKSAIVRGGALEPSVPVRRETSAAGGQRLRATASSGPARAPPELEQAVKQVKVLQSSRSPEAWHTYCREQGKESFDPARHNVTFLEDFLRRQSDSAALAAARRCGRPLRLSPARPAPDRS